MNTVCTAYDVNGKATGDATARTEQKGELNMAKLAVKNNTKGKESKVFPYEMTELVWEEEEELQKLLRREVRQIELQIKRQMFWQRCKVATLRLRSASAGN